MDTIKDKMAGLIKLCAADDDDLKKTCEAAELVPEKSRAGTQALLACDYFEKDDADLKAKLVELFQQDGDVLMKVLKEDDKFPLDTDGMQLAELRAWAIAIILVKSDDVVISEDANSKPEAAPAPEAPAAQPAPAPEAAAAADEDDEVQVLESLPEQRDPAIVSVVKGFPQGIVNILGEAAVCAIVKKHKCDSEKSFAEVVASVQKVHDTLASPMIQPMVGRVTKEKCIEIILNEKKGPDFVKNVSQKVGTLFCEALGSSQGALGGVPSLGAKPAGVKRTSEGIAKPPPASISKPRPPVLEMPSSYEQVSMPDGLDPDMKAMYVFDQRTGTGLNVINPSRAGGMRCEEDYNRMDTMAGKSIDIREKEEKARRQAGRVDASYYEEHQAAEARREEQDKFDKAPDKEAFLKEQKAKGRDGGVGGGAALDSGTSGPAGGSADLLGGALKGLTGGEVSDPNGSGTFNKSGTNFTLDIKPRDPHGAIKADATLRSHKTVGKSASAVSASDLKMLLAEISGRGKG